MVRALVDGEEVLYGFECDDDGENLCGVGSDEVVCVIC